MVVDLCLAYILSCLVLPTFCLAYIEFYIEFITNPATSFVDNSRHLRAVQAILVRKVGFDAACVLKNNLKDDTRVEHRISNV